MSLKVTRIATSGQPLAGGSTLDAEYTGDDVDITTGLPLDGLLDVNAPAPDDQDVLTWDDGAGEWIAAPPSGGDTFTVISPAQLTGNTNNWNPTGLATADEIRFSTDDSRDLTGIVAPAAAKTLLLVNVGDQELQLVHDATSTAANRFICPETSDLTLGEGESVWLVYDMTTARWRVIEVAGGGGAAPTEITDIPTAETDTALVLHPDGVGGVEWAADATGGGGGSGYDLDTYSIDGTYGDDFTGASLSGSWTRRNYTSGAETYQVGKNATYLRIAKAGRASGDGYFRTAPGGDWTFAMASILRFYTSSNVPSWGIAVVDTNGTGVGTVFYRPTPVAPLLAQITTYSTYGGNYVQPGASGTSPNVIIWPDVMLQVERKAWVYLRKSGTNYYTAYSFDGEVWSPESDALAWAGTVDRIGMMDVPLGTVTTGSGTGSVVDVDWFNKIA